MVISQTSVFFSTRGLRSFKSLNNSLCPQGVNWLCRSIKSMQNQGWHICLVSLYLSVSFRGSIGISSFEAYLPGITAETGDKTNFNALDFPSFRSVELTFQGTQLSGPNTYKWTVNGTTLDGAKDSRIRIFPQLANKGEYQVFVSNEFGTLFSRKIKLEFSGMCTFY